MKTTVPGRNGKTTSNSRRTKSARRHTPHDAESIGNIKHDANEVRGSTLETLQEGLVGPAETLAYRRARVRDVIAFYNDECDALDVIHRLLVRNRKFLISAFDDAPAGERFLFRELLLASELYLLNVDRVDHPFPATALSAAIKEDTTEVRSNTVDIEHGLEGGPHGPRGVIRRAKATIAEARALIDLLFAYVNDGFKSNRPENAKECLAGLKPIVARAHRELEECTRAAYRGMREEEY